MRFMQIESVLQTKNRSEPAKNRFSVALLRGQPRTLRQGEDFREKVWSEFWISLYALYI